MLDRDTILRLARESADIERDYRWRESFEFDDFGVIRFAHAIASLVYEDAAKVADKMARRDFNWGSESADKYHAQSDWAQLCAAAIRQRAGEMKP